MKPAPLRRWPSEAALAQAMRAVKAACGEVYGVEVAADGSFKVLSPAGAKQLAETEESAKIAARIKNAGA